MDQPEKGKTPANPRILVAPLDWGLGHATRCIPLIRELQAQGATVILAGEGAQNLLVKEEIPGLEILELKGYRVRYGKTGFDLLRNLLYQTPAILRTIKEENQWLNKLVQGSSIDGVISDNRFGLYNEKIPCVFITHQLAIKTPWGGFTEQLIQRKNYSYIERYTACWVPDAPGSNGLAGELSHPRKRPRIPMEYIGTLSRFNYEPGKQPGSHFLVLISGPEPQRSIFENLILKDLDQSAISAVVVRGLPGNTESLPSSAAIQYYNHLPASSLAAEIEKADFVIARSGYSSVMDLARLRKKTILVPTPGQTEQQYLAKYLYGKKMAYSVSQNEFSLLKAIAEAKKLNYVLEEPFVGEELKNAVQRFLGLVYRSRKMEHG